MNERVMPNIALGYKLDSQGSTPKGAKLHYENKIAFGQL